MKKQLLQTAGIVGIIASLFGIGLLANQMNGCFEPTQAPPSRQIPFSLRAIRSAQEDFRTRTVDGEKAKGYWRGDIAGLYTLKVEGQPIRLVEVAVAQADYDPKTDHSSIVGYQHLPIRNYWFRAIRLRGESTPNLERYAVCAFPAEVREYSKSTYIMSNDGVIYSKELPPGEGVSDYAVDPVKENWKKVD